VQGEHGGDERAAPERAGQRAEREEEEQRVARMESDADRVVAARVETE